MVKKIIIFEDNNGLRKGLEELLQLTDEFIVISSHDNCMQAEQQVKENTPDVILMDIDMPGRTGIEAVKLIRSFNKEVQIIMLTVFDDSTHVFDAICAGASGYLLKKNVSEKLIPSIKEVLDGGAPMSPSIGRKVLNKLQQIPQYVRPEEAPDYQLTPREKEVLACIVNGLAYKMIADQLNISYETVRSHVKKIYEKLHVASLTEAVAKAINQRIV